MAEYTNNLNLEKPSGNDNFQRQVINDNMEKVDKKFGIGTDEGHTHDGTAGQGKKISYNSLTDKPTAIAYTAGGTGTVITLAMPSFTAYNDKSLLTFIATAQNSGAATTINVNGLGAKPLYKPNTTTVPNLSAGKAYTVWYDAAGGCFFIKASAEGTAVAANVLAGMTFSNDNDVGLAGSMANNGPATAETISLTTEGAEYTIAAGFHSGLRKIRAVISGLIASVIKAGTTVGGVLGTFTGDATATAAQILTGVSAYVNGNKVAGTMPNRGGVNSAATNVDGTAMGGRVYLRPLNGYWDGTYWTYYDAPDFVAANFRADKNIFGLQGSIPVYASDSLNPSNASSYWAAGSHGNTHPRVWHRTPVGYMEGTAYGAWFYSDEPDMIPANFAVGKTAFNGQLVGIKPNVSVTAGNVYNLFYYKYDPYPEMMSGTGGYQNFTAPASQKRTKYIMGVSGGIRIKMAFHKGSSGTPGYYQIYKNSVSVVAETYVPDTDYTEYVHDIQVAVGDVVELKGRSDNGGLGLHLMQMSINEPLCIMQY